MKIIDKIHSKTDDVTKYIFRMKDGLITEFSYLNKNDGKDIICVSTQTLCAQRCKFCHVTDHIGKLKLRNVNHQEIQYGIELIIKDLNMFPIVSSHRPRPEKKNCLLISFMGCGEPLDNIDNVMLSMELLEERFHENFKTVRFAIATMIPHTLWQNFFKLAHFVKRKKIDLKIHLSLHYTNDAQRRHWMPNALPIRQSVDSLIWAVENCGVKGEIHYALINGVNDNTSDAIKLLDLLEDAPLNIKFLFFNEKDSIEVTASDLNRYEYFKFILEGVECEYYKAPGLDVGASCGQFLLDYYEDYNRIKK